MSFLVCSAALAVALTLTTLYAPSYAVTLDGEPVGVVTDEGMVQKAIQSVEETAASCWAMTTGWRATWSMSLH